MGGEGGGERRVREVRCVGKGREGDVCLFFFSSRRRHTRLRRDWSSDVCSSDLMDLMVFGELGLSGEIRPVPSGQERLKEAAKHGLDRKSVV